MDISSGKYIVLGFIVIYSFYYFRWIFRSRMTFKGETYLDEYDKTELKKVTESLIDDLSNMYGVKVPKWGFNDLTKNDYRGVYIGEIKTIYFDYEMLKTKEYYISDWFSLVVHEFTHYFDHLTLESEGKNWERHYTDRKDFYEMRADDNGKKIGGELYLNYLKDGKI